MAAEQDAIAPALAALGAVERARLDLSLNAMVVTVDAAELAAVAELPAVRSVRRLRDHQLFQTDPAPSGSLAQAATYLGVDPVRAAGIDGTGVRVAVLDTGVDFTHADLAGPGTPEAYAACHGEGEGLDAAASAAVVAPDGPCVPWFGPTAPKVKGGFDFVGERWPTGSPTEEPDPNPIDRQGHGTHVADIIAGRRADGTPVGLAPAAELYALKVCSAQGTTCSGLAALRAVDWALDPNGDGNIADAVDVMNLSFGSDYGAAGDDLSDALTNAAASGVVVVAAAGNGGDRPYKVSAPSSAPAVLSVAETTMPTARWVPIVIASAAIPALPDSTIENAVEQTWAPALTESVTAPAVRPAGELGCIAEDYTGFPVGAIAVLVRGRVRGVDQVGTGRRRRRGGRRGGQQRRRPRPLLRRRGRTRHPHAVDQQGLRRPLAGGGRCRRRGAHPRRRPPDQRSPRRWRPPRRAGPPWTARCSSPTSAPPVPGGRPRRHRYRGRGLRGHVGCRRHRQRRRRPRRRPVRRPSRRPGDGAPGQHRHHRQPGRRPRREPDVDPRDPPGRR